MKTTSNVKGASKPKAYNLKSMKTSSEIIILKMKKKVTSVTLRVSECLSKGPTGPYRSFAPKKKEGQPLPFATNPPLCRKIIVSFVSSPLLLFN